MEALFATLAQYLDYLVLGAVSFAVLCLPFGFMKPLEAGWTRLSVRVKRSHTFIQAGLIIGVLFATFYFSGYMLNAVGHAFLHRAHYSVVDSAATFGHEQKDKLTWFNLRKDFLIRIVPIVGPLFSLPDDGELNNYWRDIRRQVYWDVCDQHSFDDMTGGGIIKELRLLRGVIGLTQILLPVCVIAFALGFTKFRYVKNQGIWSLATFGVALILYVTLIIPGYWDAEYEEHSTIWATFPPELDPLTRVKMDDLLPCAKMKIVAEGKKDQASQSAIDPKDP